MKALISTVITIGMLALAVGVVIAQSGSDLFQQALVKERTDGNMAAAIALYQTIVEKHASDRALVAKALVQMGHCYEKLQQQSESRSVYERVVRDYANQKEAVSEARAWLDAHTASAGQAGLRVERVWVGSNVNLEARLVPDGRFLTFIDRTSGGNLAIRDLTTGENRLLNHDATNDDFSENPLPSPDGKQIAYRFGEKDSTIRLINLDGAQMRVLAHDRHANYLWAWSPDGKSIAATHANADRTWSIVLISASDGSIKQLRSMGSGSGSLGGFSPDGRFLVYSMDKTPTAGNGGVFALAADGSGETPLVQGSEQGSTIFSEPVWSPDGRRVIFTSDRSGARGLWSIRVANGRPEGQPDLMPANAVGTPIGFTRDGSFYYVVQETQTEAYTAEFDPEGLKVNKPVPVTDQFVGKNSEPELSPDGKYVAFIRRLGSGPQLVIRSLATREERTPIPVFKGAYGARTLQWFPDSRSVLVADRVDRRKRFRQVNVESGEARVLFEGPWEVWIGALSPDGKVLFYSIKEDGSLRLMKRRLDTGEQTELYRTDFESDSTGLFGLTVSPDGTKLAFAPNVVADGRALMIMSADWGAPRTILRSPRLFSPSAMSWTRDGRYLVVTASGPDKNDGLYAISTEGGELKPLGITMEDIPSRMISADGRRIAFTGATSKHELWVIRNLLSEPVKAR